jgi:Ca2+-binding EF-hand superfamily protein
MPRPVGLRLICNLQPLSVATTPHIHTAIRPFVAESGVRQKFFAIMDEYKMRNYAQTVPSRFIKDMRKATDVNGDNEITMSEMKNMLKNIGADDKISDDELKSLFDEVGADLNGERVIHVDDMVKVWKEHSTVL